MVPNLGGAGGFQSSQRGAGADILYFEVGLGNTTITIIIVISFSSIKQVNTYSIECLHGKSGTKQRYSFELCHTDYIRSAQTAAQRRVS